MFDFIVFSYLFNLILLLTFYISWKEEFLLIQYWTVMLFTNYIYVNEINSIMNNPAVEFIKQNVINQNTSSSSKIGIIITIILILVFIGLMFFFFIYPIILNVNLFSFSLF